MRPIGTLGALAAGALAMYYLDPELGAQRRRLLAELVRSGLPRERRPERLRPRVYHRVTQADPQSDADLRDQIQQRLGRLVSYPGAIDVGVDNGVVRLSGRVLAKEREGLLEQVQQMAGVQKLVNAMTSLDDPQDMGRAPATASPSEDAVPPGEPQPAT
ncbi:MAG TPA: BON domain-containing protein [Ramlibacter sp.]|uniref:BON domain-containing protein n=1 Tax=Ramlibacter sp. TaxID=1917967 RepID=UPI002D80DA6C|nr:BON domain-containing protein [Ramlibacter sp.]HET8745450.1 BON domain-containing protein [Ramlibacter sp.]